MFSDIKHQLGKEGKRAVALLATVTLLCSFMGCAGNEASSVASDSVASGLQSTSVAGSKDSQSLETNLDNTGSSGAQNEQSNGQSEFDFDEAVKNIVLFDQKISLPCTIKDFGEDFSLIAIVPAEGLENQMFCDLLYKGKMIGNVFLKDCKENDKFEEKEIVTMSLGDADWSYPFSEHTKAYMKKLGKYTDLIQLDFGGFSMCSDEEDVRAIFGASPNITELSNKRYWLDYDFERGNISITIENNRINEILISLK